MTDFPAAFRSYLATRRSTPFPLFSDKAPEAAELSTMLRLAARVPDHGKLAPWRFIIIDPKAGARLGEKLVAFGQQDGADEKRLAQDATRFSRAPLCVAVVSRAAPHAKIPQWEQVLSAGACCLNLIHAAEAHGYGAVWVTEWPAYDARVLRELGLDAHEKIAGFVHIGAVSSKAEDRARPEMATITAIYEG